jgi:hypothetical protein
VKEVPLYFQMFFPGSKVTEHTRKVDEDCHRIVMAVKEQKERARYETEGLTTA